MNIQSKCNKCEAPIFFNRVTDFFGNSVVSLNCWNGHYAWIEIENIDFEEDSKVKKASKGLILYMGFCSEASRGGAANKFEV